MNTSHVLFLSAVVLGACGDDGGAPPDAAAPDAELPCGSSCTGDTVWAITFGDAAAQRAGSVTVRDDTIRMTGAFAGTINPGNGALISAGGEDAYLLRLTGGGDVTDGDRYGDAGDQRLGHVAVMPDGGVVVAASFTTTHSFGGKTFTALGAADIVVARLDAGGAHVWSEHYGSVDLEAVNGVTTDGDGNVYLVGFAGGTLDFGGGPLTSAGMADIVVAKLDPDGGHLWSQIIGDTAGDYALDIDLDGDGILRISGVSGTGFDAPAGSPLGAGGFVVELDASGLPRTGVAWSDTTIQSVEGHHVAGYFEAPVDLGGGTWTNEGLDAFVAELDSGYGLVWSRHLGGAGNELAGQLVVDDRGDVIVAGGFDVDIDLGGGPLTADADGDHFIGKLDGGGEPLWSRTLDTDGSLGVASMSDGGAVAIGAFSDTIDLGDGAIASAGATDVFIVRLAP